jgi:hypothetical protein
VLALIALLTFVSLTSSLQTQPARINPNAKAIAKYEEGIAQYVTLHRELEATLPPLPADPTPMQVYQRQRDLERLIQGRRRGAKQGDLFVREVRPVLRRLLYAVFKNPEGNKLKRAIGEERPPQEVVKLQINARYPDTIPLSTVPAPVLAALPQLPEELEYRFIDDQLILLDAHAHIIADYLTGAVPR